MLRVRDKSGKLLELAAGAVVEFTDKSGLLAVVVMQDATGAVNILTPPDPRMSAYASATNQHLSSSVKVHEPKTK